MNLTAATLDTDHPARETAARLGAIAALWSRFATLGYSAGTAGGYATARIATGNATLASARGRTVAAAAENLLRKVDALPFLAAPVVSVLHPAAYVIEAAAAVDTDQTLRCIGCSFPLAGRAHLGVTTRFGEKIHYCTAACRGSFGVAR